MLHMTVATHGPETCPAVSEEARQKALARVPKMEEVMKAHGCTIQGGWANRSNHTSYVLIDAPNAHAAENAIRELELPHWNTVAIHPVVPLQDAIADMQGP